MFCLAPCFRVSLPPIGEAASTRAIDKRLAPLSRYQQHCLFGLHVAWEISTTSHSIHRMHCGRAPFPCNPHLEQGKAPSSAWGTRLPELGEHYQRHGIYFLTTADQLSKALSNHLRRTTTGKLCYNLGESRYGFSMSMRFPAIMNLNFRRLPWAFNNEMVIQTVSNKDP